MKNRIAYTKPSITELEISYATDAVENGWGKKCYDYIERFEDAFKKHLGVKYAVATSSATGALHLGLSALNIMPGDEVILADTNWIASVAPIVHLGAKPIFIDIKPDTWCINPKLIEKKITKRTKAILAVHLYGSLCDMKHLLNIGKKYNIPIIEDAAEAIGSKYFSKPAGTMGIFGAFSFHGTKTLTTGEGGMFVTSNKKLYEKVLTLNNHGRSPKEKKMFWSEIVGYKFKISNIQAAIGLAQVKRIRELVNRKKEILKFYKKRLSIIDGVELNFSNKDMNSGAWMPNIVFPKKSNLNSKILLEVFHKNNIDARPFFWPLSSLPMFKSCPQNIVAYDLAKRSINLPSFHEISTNSLEEVCKIIIDLNSKLNH